MFLKQPCLALSRERLRNVAWSVLLDYPLHEMPDEPNLNSQRVRGRKQRKTGGAIRKPKTTQQEFYPGAKRTNGRGQIGRRGPERLVSRGSRCSGRVRGCAGP
jgi:hypothetical protein